MTETNLPKRVIFARYTIVVEVPEAEAETDDQINEISNELYDIGVAEELEDFLKGKFRNSRRLKNAVVLVEE